MAAAIEQRLALLEPTLPALDAHALEGHQAYESNRRRSVANILKGVGAAGLAAFAVGMASPDVATASQNGQSTIT